MKPGVGDFYGLGILLADYHVLEIDNRRDDRDFCGGQFFGRIFRRDGSAAGGKAGDKNRDGQKGQLKVDGSRRCAWVEL